jgi:tetratricopeptide (TPR) repeat protein
MKRSVYCFCFLTLPAAFTLLTICACESGVVGAAAEKLYLAAVEAYTEQRYDAALGFIREALRADKNFYQAAFLEAKILFFQGNEDESERRFLRLVQKYPSYTEARIWYIRCLIISGQNGKALSALEEELSFNNTDWRVYYLYALLGEKTNNYEQRLSMNRKAETALTESAKVYMDLALIWRALGMNSRAGDYLRKAETVSGSNISISRLESALEQAAGNDAGVR